MDEKFKYETAFFFLSHLKDIVEKPVFAGSEDEEDFKRLQKESLSLGNKWILISQVAMLLHTCLSSAEIPEDTRLKSKIPSGVSEWEHFGKEFLVDDPMAAKKYFEFVGEQIIKKGLIPGMTVEHLMGFLITALMSVTSDMCIQKYLSAQTAAQMMLSQAQGLAAEKKIIMPDSPTGLVNLIDEAKKKKSN